MAADAPPVIDHEYHHRAAYSEGAGIYRFLPSGIATPRDVSAVQELVHWAGATRTSLIPRGAGSGMSGGNVGDGVVVDLTKHLVRWEIQARDHRASVQAGAVFGTVDGAARVDGLRLPPAPSSARFCTFGGMVACNAAGARSLAYGSIREWVDGLTVVWPDGTVEHVLRGRRTSWSTARELEALILPQAAHIEATYPRTRKNAAGYALDVFLRSRDIIDLLIGSEGTLGIITDIDVRLDAVPNNVGCLLVGLGDRAALGAGVNALTTAGAVAIELLDRTFLALVEDRAPFEVPEGVDAVLIAEFEAPSAKALRGRIGDAVRGSRPLDPWIKVGLSDDDADAIWALRHAASPILADLPSTRRSVQVIEDGCVPLDRVTDYVHGVREISAQIGIDVVMFGHAGDGHIHVNALVNLEDAAWHERLTQLFQATTDLVIRLGGTVSGEHGAGRLRARALERMYGKKIVDLFREIKHTVDPQGILNPGVIVPEDRGALESLKLGGHGPEIPSSVEVGLRSMERHADWGRDKSSLTP